MQIASPWQDTKGSDVSHWHHREEPNIFHLPSGQAKTLTATPCPQHSTREGNSIYCVGGVNERLPYVGCVSTVNYDVIAHTGCLPSSRHYTQIIYRSCLMWLALGWNGSVVGCSVCPSWCRSWAGFGMDLSDLTQIALQEEPCGVVIVCGQGSGQPAVVSSVTIPECHFYVSGSQWIRTHRRRYATWTATINKHLPSNAYGFYQ